MAGVLAGLLLLGGAALGRAQQEAPRQQWLRLETVQIKPERWAEYRAIYRDEVIPALRKGGVPSQAAWRTAEFGSTYEVVLVTPFQDFAFFDSGDLFSRVMEPRDAERLREKLRRCIDRRSIAALRQRSDLSAGEELRPFAVVSSVSVAPGQNLAFERFLRDTLPGVAKAGVVFGVYERVYGEPAAWILVQNLDSLRELSQPDALQRGFPTDASSRLSAELSGILTGIERRVFRYDPELSFAFPSAAPPAP